MKRLRQLINKALGYFIDNMSPTSGLVLDRQSNFEDGRDGCYSTSATGMGLIATALASTEPYNRLSHTTACKRVRMAIQYALDYLPHDNGVMPHFIDADQCTSIGSDHFSTIDSAWLIAGSTWASTFLCDQKAINLADKLYGRVNWNYWLDSHNRIRHGKDQNGKWIGAWDRLSAESLFMHVMAAGAAPADGARLARALAVSKDTCGGEWFCNADYGLFTSQWSLDLLDLAKYQSPFPDLIEEARKAAAANYNLCNELRRPAAWNYLVSNTNSGYLTYQRYWGLSAGDGPDGYKAYGTRSNGCPWGVEVDGTANVVATIASWAYAPHLCFDNLSAALANPTMCGKYGFSNVNVDRDWISHDVVGIDLGALIMHLDNWLHDGRVRKHFSSQRSVVDGLYNLGFSPRMTTRTTA